jgi:hypothetical protein
MTDTHIVRDAFQSGLACPVVTLCLHEATEDNL